MGALFDYPSDDRQVFSIGFLCGTFQRSPAELLRLLKAAGHRPKMVVNNVPHFDGFAARALSEMVQEGKADA